MSASILAQLALTSSRLHTLTTIELRRILVVASFSTATGFQPMVAHAWFLRRVVHITWTCMQHVSLGPCMSQPRLIAHDRSARYITHDKSKQRSARTSRYTDDGHNAGRTVTHALWEPRAGASVHACRTYSCCNTCNHMQLSFMRDRCICSNFGSQQHEFCK